MKKIVVFILVLMGLSTFVYAEKEVTFPQTLMLNSDKGTLVSAMYLWGATAAENTCIVTYKVQTNDRAETYKTVTFTISGTDFSDLVNGYGGTMESRLETAVWQDTQSKFELVP